MYTFSNSDDLQEIAIWKDCKIGAYYIIDNTNEYNTIVNAMKCLDKKGKLNLFNSLNLTHTLIKY